MSGPTWTHMRHELKRAGVWRWCALCVVTGGGGGGGDMHQAEIGKVAFAGAEGSPRWYCSMAAEGSRHGSGQSEEAFLHSNPVRAREADGAAAASSASSSTGGRGAMGGRAGSGAAPAGGPQW